MRRSGSAAAETQGGAGGLPAAPAGAPQGLRIEAAGWLVGVAFALVFVPSWIRLASTSWGDSEHGHGPLVLILSGWLAWRARHRILAGPAAPAPAWGWTLLAAGALAYALGRSQAIDTLEAGALLPVLAGLLLVFRGGASLRAAWVPIAFLFFMVPLPGVFVIALTTPLKVGVSAVAESLLYAVGYPVARTGVVLAVGQYRLLVADACAGLASMFTLEAIGLLYASVMGYVSVWRKLVIALVSIPFAFFANVARVIILTLVTWHFGEAAGQGFLHSAAGIFMFTVATLLLLGFDELLRRAFPNGRFSEVRR